MQILIKNTPVIIDDEDFHIIGTHAWEITNKGYAAFRTTRKPNRRLIFFHRLVLGLPSVIEMADRNSCIDHINRDKLDNRKCNLRIVSQSLNRFNTIKLMQGTSKYKGVHHMMKSWYAKIGFQRRQIRIISSESEDECAYAYNCAVDCFKIEHAYRNPVDSLSEETKLRIFAKVKKRLIKKGFITCES